MKIVVVIPTKNEGARIGRTIEEIREIFDRLDGGSVVGARDGAGATARKKWDAPVILITDDSKDDTRAIARKMGAEVVSGGGKGLGFAMYQGLKSSLEYAPDYIVAYDADGQCDPNEIPLFVDELVAGRADMVLASRFIRPGLVHYRYPLLNRFGTVVLSAILRYFTGLPHTDSHGGIRAMVPEVVQELEMLGTHTYVQEAIIDAHEKGFRIVEIPSVWLKREHGSSRVVASIPTYIFYTLPILILRARQHIKWMYTTGILLVAAAFLYFGFVFAEGGFSIVPLINRVPALLLVTVFIVTGFQLFFFGFILQLLKNIKYSVDRAAYHAERGGRSERRPDAAPKP